MHIRGSVEYYIFGDFHLWMTAGGDDLSDPKLFSMFGMASLPGNSFTFIAPLPCLIANTFHKLSTYSTSPAQEQVTLWCFELALREYMHCVFHPISGNLTRQIWFWKISTKTWASVRPPPLLGQKPKFFRKFILMAPLTVVFDDVSLHQYGQIIIHQQYP